ncbi:ATP synthase subunit H [Nitzschia inconspicua]|uniref:ATP synthase subunit H n=1 Tax=Nitzschia inconspicua TaxID=303405 RepID=A0A9K3KV37_9STRA|nr:ATP synthase subunit H [Nitzschia inconspicua]
MSGIPSTLVTGTIAYLVAAVVLIGIVQAARGVGKLSKDDAGTGNVVVIIAVIAMWLFWLCAWMHQWHPLIQPIYEG